jgi:hypothetical protein
LCVHVHARLVRARRCVYHSTPSGRPPTCVLYMHEPCCVLQRHGCRCRHRYGAGGRSCSCDFSCSVVMYTLDPPVSVIPHPPAARRPCALRCMHLRRCNGHRNSRPPAHSSLLGLLHSIHYSLQLASIYIPRPGASTSTSRIHPSIHPSI